MTSVNVWVALLSVDSICSWCAFLMRQKVLYYLYEKNRMVTRRPAPTMKPRAAVISVELSLTSLHVRGLR